MEKKIYFLSPLEAEIFEKTNETDAADDIWGGVDLLEYQEEICKAIEKRDQWSGADLMRYYDRKDSVKEKVKALQLTVVEYRGELKGCAVATVSSSLGRREMDQLKEYLTEQYTDGWGKKFQQAPIQADDFKMYVHFWNWENFRFEVLREVGPLDQAKPESQDGLKMQLDLRGPDGNIYAAEGKAVLTLYEAGRYREAEEMDRRIRQSGNYYRALDIINEYVRIEPDYRKQLLGKVEKKKADRER